MPSFVLAAGIEETLWALIDGCTSSCSKIICKLKILVSGDQFWFWIVHFRVVFGWARPHQIPKDLGLVSGHLRSFHGRRQVELVVRSCWAMQRSAADTRIQLFGRLSMFGGYYLSALFRTLKVGRGWLHPIIVNRWVLFAVGFRS